MGVATAADFHAHPILKPFPSHPPPFRPLLPPISHSTRPPSLSTSRRVPPTACRLPCLVLLVHDLELTENGENETAGRHGAHARVSQKKANISSIPSRPRPRPRCPPRRRAATRSCWGRRRAGGRGTRAPTSCRVRAPRARSRARRRRRTSARGRAGAASGRRPARARGRRGGSREINPAHSGRGERG